VALYFIETQCFTVEDRSLFLGTLDQVRARLDELSDQGWMVAAAFEVSADGAIRAGQAWPSASGLRP